MTCSDQQLREVLAPLRADEPSAEEVAAVLAAVSATSAPTSVRGRRWRPCAGIGVATACAVAVLAALPGSPPGPRGGAPQSAFSILDAAAATAAEQPAPTGSYRYVEWLDRWSEPPRPEYANAPAVGPVTYEQRVETWVDEHYEGRTVQHRGRVLSGDRDGAKGSAFYQPSKGPYVYGEAPRTQLAKLPTEPHALRDALVAEYQSLNWAPGLPTANQTHYDLVRKVVYLLGQAGDPQLREALFGLLAITPGVEPAPEAEDPRGRSGKAVRIPTRQSGGGGTITVIFDSSTTELLSWSETGSGSATPDQSHTILRAGQVAAIGERPGASG